MKRRILIVDDEPEMARLVASWLSDGAEVFTASDPVGGIDVLLREVPDVAITDVVMPSGGGRRFVTEARRYLPGCALIGMSGQARPSDFVDMFRLGLSDFLAKPFDRDDLKRAITRALRVRSLRDALARVNGSLATDDPFTALLGESAPWREALKTLRSAAGIDAGVLIVGAPGTGKDLAARCLHAASERREGPLVMVSCAALPESLLEAELFGHVAGAFTGATNERAGRFMEAHGGTLVLTDIGTIPLVAQARLLRALDAGAIQRLGDPQEREVDVRIVATTARDPWEDVAQGRMREDLAHRLNRLRVDLPPLAERGDDLLLLAAHLLAVQASREQRRILALAPDAIDRLRQHSWPGNVRELANALERAGIGTRDAGIIRASDLRLGRLGGVRLDPADWPLPEEGLDLRAVLATAEQDLVRQAMERASGHHARAAALLRIGRSTLERKLPAAGI